MLMNMKELLAVADKNEFAVPAFNIGSESILKGVVEGANEKDAPVILAIHPTELEFLGDSFIKTCIEEANKSRVPMVIHLDHGGKFEEVLRAIRCGFTSVMIDASHMSYEDNIAITKINDKCVKSIKDIKIDDNINIIIKDGEINAKVMEVKNER